MTLLSLYTSATKICFF